MSSGILRCPVRTCSQLSSSAKERIGRHGFMSEWWNEGRCLVGIEYMIGGGRRTTFTLSAFTTHWSSDPVVLLYVEGMPCTVACWPYLYYSVNCLSDYFWARGTYKSKPVAVAVLCHVCRLTEGSTFWSSSSSMSSSRFHSWKLISCYPEVSVCFLCSTLRLSSLSCSTF